MSSIFNTTAGAVVTQALSLGRRQEVVLSNDLANYDTPGFKSQTLKFQSALAQAMTNGPQAVQKVSGTMVTDQGSLRPDGNSVSMTATEASLASAQLYYETAVQSFNQKTTDLKIVTEGRPL